MTGGLTVALARRLIAGAPWAQDRLRRFAGQTIEWDVAGLTGCVQLDEQGLPARPLATADDPAAPAGRAPGGASAPSGRAPSPAPSGRPGVRVTLAAADLPAIGQGIDALMRCVNLEGNAGLASELGFIARNLQPDPEEWLAPWLGDAVAERAGRGLRGGAAWALGSGRRAAQAGAGFAVNQAGLLPDPAAVGAYCRGVDEVRESSDRLAQRIARLERRSPR